MKSITALLVAAAGVFIETIPSDAREKNRHYTLGTIKKGQVTHINFSIIFYD